MFDATQQDVSCGGGVGWGGYDASVHTLHMSTTCDNFCFQNAMRWTASVHILHMSKPVITFVVKVLRD